MRLTKIVATVGPACYDYAVFKKMVKAGVDIVRFNLSHAHDDNIMQDVLLSVARVNKELKTNVQVMLDTRGPEIRVGVFENGRVEIKKGSTFVFTNRQVVGDATCVSVSYPKFSAELKAGNIIKANDGLICFKVKKVEGKDVYTKAMNSGVLSNRKSLFVPDVNFDFVYLNDADKQDILWGIKHKVPMVAASFVNSKKDVETLRKFITKHGSDMKIIAKIESELGVENLDEIIESADGVMVARGDLGVELPMEQLPAIQKDMILRANGAGKFVITATEMLESMISSPRPTRAEVSDVANAVYDGTSAVMLSGETASGQYPVEAVEFMCKIVKETEKHI
ncbi:MAG: pyruvate kinase [Clostridia bacterium]|nr:pyruvate kinase [Clostridia bacterium]